MTAHDNAYSLSTRQALLILALAPALAVSDTVANALGLGVVAIVTLTVTTIAASLLRGLHDDIRWMIHILIFAALVSGCGLLLNAGLHELHRSLGLFLPLLAANAFMALRAEAATQAGLPGAFASGMRAGVAVALVLLILGIAREIVGRGSLLHNAGLMFGDWARPLELQLFRADMGFLLAMLPPGAFIALGLLLAIWKWIGRTKPTGMPKQSDAATNGQ